MLLLEIELFISKFYFFDYSSLPSLKKVDIIVPFFPKNINKKMEFSLLVKFLEIVLKFNPPFKGVYDKAINFKLKKEALGYYFLLTIPKTFFKNSFYFIVFLHFISQEKRSLFFYDYSFLLILKDLEDASFFLDDYKINLNFRFVFDHIGRCNRFNLKSFLSFFSLMYNLGYKQRIHRDDFKFYKKA